MLARVEISGAQVITYAQEWSVENRLAVVTNTVTGEATRFVYDGDGVRVLREDPSGLTVNMGAIEVEISGTQRLTTTYYFAGGQRIAMRKDGEITYLHGDYLGSASLATDASGAKVSEMRYTPFGETRYGDAPTDRRFTGQREEAGIGLYDYEARFYSASVGRFVSADSMVPQANNSQDFNRYSCVGNNPLNRIDSTGHYPLFPQSLWLEMSQLLFNWYSMGGYTMFTGMPIEQTPMLSGRAEVQRHKETIYDMGLHYFSKSGMMLDTLVAVSIAEQSSDWDRLYGWDWIDKASQIAKPDASVGIAQLRPSEMDGLGLTGQNPFDPQVAIQGMYEKITQANLYIDSKLAGSGEYISITDRWMLLALAQNSGNEPINKFFEKSGDWAKMLPVQNYAWILRYFVLHLDWAISTGDWCVPSGVDLDYWRDLVFNYTGPEGQ